MTTPYRHIDRNRYIDRIAELEETGRAMLAALQGAQIAPRDADGNTPRWLEDQIDAALRQAYAVGIR